MVFTVSATTVYNCSLERAFKTPMLSDVTKVHTGKGVMPKVIGVTEDEDWGQVGSVKKILVGKSATFKGGESSTDKVLERVENDYWKIEVSNFKSWIMGFTKFVGTWKTIELAPNKIRIDYTYELHAGKWYYYPMNWLFVRLFWKGYMKQVLENIRQMTLKKEPYLYP